MHVSKNLREDSNQRSIQKQAWLGGPILPKRQDLPVNSSSSMKQRH